MTNKDIWTIKLDWLRIIHILSLNSINEIPELKKEKAIKKITKIYGTDTLLSFSNDELDLLVVNELKELMRRELAIKARRTERIERKMQNQMIPFKNGGIIRFDPKDLENMDPNAIPEELFKHLKKLMGKGDPKENDDNDEDQDNYKEDNTGYYI